MAKKWVEVASSPAYQALAPEQQEEARSQYWNEVIAPQVPEQERETVRQQFDADTSPTVNWPGAGSMEIAITGGQLEPEKAPDPTDGMSALQKIGAGAGKSVVDTYRGAKQFATQGLLGQAAAGSAVARKAGLNQLADLVDTGAGRNLLASLTEQQAAIDESKRLDAPLMNTGAGVAGNVLGNLATLALPVGELGVATRGLGLLGRAAVSVPTGAAIGAAQPVASDESRLQNAVIGGALGPVGEVAGAAVGALGRRAAASVDPIRQRAIEFAREQNIPLHLSQVSESLPAKTMASVAQYLPFSGAGKAANQQQSAFNRAVARTFGADADQLSDEVMRQSRRGLSQRFEDIYNRNDIPLGQQEIASLAAINNAATRRLTQDEAGVVANQFDDIIGELNQAGVLTGQKYQALRSQIMKAEGPDKVGQAVASLRKELDSIAASAVGPDDSAALKQLRSQWANLRTTEAVLKQVAGAGGDVRPAALWPAVRNGSTQEMRNLARLGQTVMKNPVPDSGTAGRLAATSMLGTGGLAAGGGLPGLVGLIAGGATVGRALNSNALARLATATPAGAGLNLLARLLPPAAVTAVPATAAARNRNEPAQKPRP